MPGICGRSSARSRRAPRRGRAGQHEELLRRVQGRGRTRKSLRGPVQVQAALRMPRSRCGWRRTFLESAIVTQRYRGCAPHADAIRVPPARHESSAQSSQPFRIASARAWRSTDERGASLRKVIAAFMVAERLLDLDKLGAEIDHAERRGGRIDYSRSPQAACARIGRPIASGRRRNGVRPCAKSLEPGVRKIATAATN